MFLITTADERTWKSNEKIVFLGEWCKLYSRKSVWSKKNYEVLPYHWDDRNRLRQDFQYLEDVYERYLKALADKLNQLHGTDRSLRYWRIIIGPWLRYFSDTIYDRYRSLKMAAETKTITLTHLMMSDEAAWTPKDYEQFCCYQTTDQWNHFIYGQIIKLLGNIPFQTVNEHNLPPPRNKPVGRPSLWRRILKYVLRQYVKIVPKQLGEIAFISSYFSHKSLIKLQLTLRQMPNLYWGMIELPDTAVNKQLRGQLKLNIANNEFEKILETLIPAQIPIAYIEAFRDLQARAGGYYRNGVKVIYTANAYSGDEGFKIWCAEKVEKGAKFAIGQHGGNMGTSLIQQSEDHQIAVSDRFYSWGWINRDEKIIKPMPAGKLIDLRKNVRSDPNGPILWVTASLPRYSYCLYSVPIGPQYLNYMKSQIAFAKRTSKPAFELLQIRLDNSDFGWDFEARLKDNGLERKIQRNCDDFIGSLKKSRLCIATHNSTSFLETLAANYPTLIFWDPRYYELRPKAQKYFDGLRQVGILHDTPESAAATLNEIYLDPLSWWRQSARQAVKDQFCDQFAYIGDNWIQQWRKELMSL